MSENLYESADLLSQYLLFHYGSDEEVMPWAFGPKEALGFPVRCVTECLRLGQLPERARALDVGCAVGRSTMELSRHCHEAIGVDYSHTFVFAAATLCREGSIPYEITELGTIRRRVFAHLPKGVDCARIQFRREDAQSLPESLGAFDVVLAANLLCRLPEPKRFLDRLPALVKAGGQLILTTPHTWMREFTAPEFWIGATPQTGEPLEALQKHLEDNFRLDAVKDLPFVIREHARKFQWSVAQATVWTRRTS